MTAKKTIMILAIAVLFAFFVGYGVQTFYPEPEYNKICPSSCQCGGIAGIQCPAGYICELPTDMMDACGYCYNPSSGEPAKFSPPYCNYQVARDTYDQKVSIILGFIGLAAIFVGIKGPRMESYISAGIMLGGVITLIYGTTRYWQHFTDVTRFFVIGIFLALLIYLGTKYKKYFK